jgi:alkanesulfonate monooxygenase SsuD/methylene tetrahydromethanopterin reductase-like flavin-dependent oxidoreductase (luciferase family)
VDPARRRQTVVETVDIVRRVWFEDHVSYDGEIFSIDDVTIRPRPSSPIPILFGGPSRHAVRLAGTHFDGWIAGIIPLDTLDARLAELRDHAATAGRTMFISAVPRMRIERNRATARAGLDPARMFHEFLRNWEPRANGSFETLADFRGAIWAGEPTDIVEAVLEYDRRQVDHFVFDLRDQFARFEETLELIAERVIPEVRSATAMAG